jgi:HEAT repeat protein
MARRAAAASEPCGAPLRALLEGGDRRSLALSGEALALARGDDGFLAALVGLLDDADPLVVMRAIDALEKLAHERPERLQRHRGSFIGPLANHAWWEVRLQIARALPLLEWTARERARAVTILSGYLVDPKLFVRAWALDGLARFSGRDATLQPRVASALEAFERSEHASLRARARNIRRALAGRAGEVG